jgi:hypothetical protein
MKKLLLVVLVTLGLNQTQAQVNWCDSMTVVGNQSSMTFEINGMNTFITRWNTSTPSFFGVLAIDSLQNFQTVFNFNPLTGLPYDTLNVCVWYGTDSCCVDWIWNSTNGMWAKMGIAQQPYFCCDSITYWTDQSQGFNIGLDTSGIIHNPDSINVWWSVCTNGLCYTGDGMYDYFPQVTTSDTLKVGYDVYLYENGVVEVCTMEEWLIFDGTNWVLFNSNNPVGIEEIMVNYINNNKIYDLTGRELTEEPIGVMYIRNRKLYIKTQ